MPLGLARTTWTAPVDDDWARPYRDRGRRRPVPTSEPLGDGALAPMGGLWSCVDDLVTWMAWLDDAFPARDGADDGPLRRASRRELQQVHRATRLARRPARGDGLDHMPERIDGGGYGLRAPGASTTTASGRSSGTRADCPATARTCAGCPGGGSAPWPWPTRRTPRCACSPAGCSRLLDDHGLVPTATRAGLPPTFGAAAERLVALLSDWNDDVADRAVRRQRRPRRVVRPAGRAAAAALTGDHGALHVDDVVASTAAAGTITYRRGRWARRDRSTLRLSPHVPPLIQDFEIRAEHPHR